jgi:DNA-3-methyladenine glycosylase
VAGPAESKETLKPPRGTRPGDGSAKLLRPFYARDPRRVAKDLLGKVLVHVDGGIRRAARVVETEAYCGQEDQASHARFGPTRRAAIMFGPPGVAYVYLVYGLSHCFNVVTGEDGLASAVLVRAGEPVEGCLHSTSGPGNLCRALSLRRETHNGLDLAGDLLFIESAEGAEGAPRPVERTLASPRVNVGFAGTWADRPWRFSLEGNRFVSKPWPAPRSTSRSRAR